MSPRVSKKSANMISWQSQRQSHPPWYMSDDMNKGLDGTPTGACKDRSEAIEQMFKKNMSSIAFSIGSSEHMYGCGAVEPKRWLVFENFFRPFRFG